jgi:hypothetical protein
MRNLSDSTAKLHRPIPHSGYKVLLKLAYESFECVLLFNGIALSFQRSSIVASGYFKAKHY